MFCFPDNFMQESGEHIQIGQSREVLQFLWYGANCIKGIYLPASVKEKYPMSTAALQ